VEQKIEALAAKLEALEAKVETKAEVVRSECAGLYMEMGDGKKRKRQSQYKQQPRRLPGRSGLGPHAAPPTDAGSTTTLR
jgi:hypothetical protein